MQVRYPTSNATVNASHSPTAAEFRRRSRWLIFHTWNIPSIFGLGFILLIGVLKPTQVLGILVTAIEPAYILGWLVFAIWFLPHSMRPLTSWLDSKPGRSSEPARIEFGRTLIDGGFIKNMLDDPMDHAIVEAINNFGHVVGLKTVAEFVESDAIKQRLIEVGVDYAHGYAIERPAARGSARRFS